MLPIVVALTAMVVTANVAEEEFAGTVTEEGRNAAGLAFDRFTVVAKGAGTVSVMLPVDFWPPITLAGLSDSEATLTGAAVDPGLYPSWTTSKSLPKASQRQD